MAIPGSGVLGRQIQRIAGRGGKEVLENVGRLSPDLYNQTSRWTKSGISDAIDHKLVEPEVVENAFKSYDYDSIDNIGTTGAEARSSAIRREQIHRSVNPPQAAIDSSVARENQLFSEAQDITQEGAEKLKTRGGGDVGMSIKSTGPEMISGDKRIYQLGSKQREFYKIYEDMLPGLDGPALEWHHKFSKSVSGPYYQRAWELYDAGLATKQDILAMHRYALDQGVGSGDRISSIAMLSRLPHNKLHTFLREIGFELSSSTTTKAQKSAAGRKLKPRPSTNSPLKQQVGSIGSDGLTQGHVSKIDNITDLVEGFKGEVDQALVATRQGELLQQGWEDIPLALRSDMLDVWMQREKIKFALRANKGKQPQQSILQQQWQELDDIYQPKKTQLKKLMMENRAKYGEELDEFGNPDPESYGQFEIKRDLEQDRISRNIDSQIEAAQTQKSGATPKGKTLGGNKELSDFSKNVAKRKKQSKR